VLAMIVMAFFWAGMKKKKHLHAFGKELVPYE